MNSGIAAVKNMAPGSLILGPTAQGTPIHLHRLGSGLRNLLIIGGVHGDEPEGYYLIERFLTENLASQLDSKISLFVIPRLNPDGCAREERRNSQGVDLNRNMPTKDWSPIVAKERYHPGPAPGSEIETQILMNLIENIKPAAIVSAHSWNPMINYNGPCKAWAEYMSQLTGYVLSDDIGYPTPGSLGTWAGWERNIPTITLEIERHLPLEQVWQLHGPALLKTLQWASNKKDLNLGA